MIANIVGIVVRSLASGSVKRDERGNGAIRRAYYNGVIMTIVAFPTALFILFMVAGAMNLANGHANGWFILLAGLGGTLLLGWLLLRDFVRHAAQWTDTGVRFSWFNGEADLTWDQIDRIEVRPLNRNAARIRFRDGRMFGMTSPFSGGNALLAELARRGVPVVKWGTVEPLPAHR